MWIPSLAGSAHRAQSLLRRMKTSGAIRFAYISLYASLRKMRHRRNCINGRALRTARPHARLTRFAAKGYFIITFRLQTAPINSTMRLRCAAFGSRVRAALRLSIMYSGLSVPGSTALMASCASRYLRKNWPHVGASNSALAQPGTA